VAVTADDVRAAAAVLAGRIAGTPCVASEALSRLAGCELVLKFENLHTTGSFKERGALNKLASLTAAERERGVIAASAGNHAQGVAHHAANLGIRATIVMPRFTPFVKVANTERLGAKVVLAGEGVDEAAAHARELEAREGLIFIHPYDDPLVIAGQGTVALEMLAERPDLEVLVVPIGGGGLIAGMATAAKALKPDIEVVGVQAAASPSAYRKRAGLPEAPPRPTIAEGIAVKTPGKLTWPIIQALVDEILLVDEPVLEEAVLHLLETEKTVIEGAGAAGLAAVMSSPERFAGRHVGLVLCGGNIDVRLLSAVILRGLVRSRRLIWIQVGVPDAPGNLARVTALIGETGGNIVEVSHQRAFSPLSVKSSEVNLIIETRNATHAAEVTTALKAAGFEVRALDHTSGGGI
jgi:threonine dehydratase